MTSSEDHLRAAENLLEEAESHREPDTRAEWCLELAKVHLALAQAASALDPRWPERLPGPPAGTTNADRHEPATRKIFTPTEIELGDDISRPAHQRRTEGRPGPSRTGTFPDTYAPHDPGSDVPKSTLHEGDPTWEEFRKGRETRAEGSG